MRSLARPKVRADPKTGSHSSFLFSVPRIPDLCWPWRVVPGGLHPQGWRRSKQLEPCPNTHPGLGIPDGKGRRRRQPFAKTAADAAAHDDVRPAGQSHQDLEIHTLVYYELHADMNSAITREKQMRKWRRAWKIELIETGNPHWRDLWPDIL